MHLLNLALNIEIKSLNSALQKAQKELAYLSSILPDGRYCLRVNRGYPRFSFVTGSRSKGTLKDSYIALNDSPTSVSHIHRYYLLLLIPKLQAELDALEHFQVNYTPMEKYKIYANIPESMREFLDPIVSPFEVQAREWANAHYISNSMDFDETQKYYTKCGIRVRSRAEMVFGDLMTSLGLYYRYEFRYKLANGSFLYPDFAVMHPLTGEIHYIEYFGLMSSDDYRNKTFRKIQQYQASKDASRFHFFFESDEVGFNSVAFRNTLTKIFLAE